jgi:hypothetical protein
MPYERTQQARIDAGLCKDCGKPRGDDGTTIRCRACAEAASVRSAARTKQIRKERLEAGLCYRCGRPRDALTVLCSTCLGKNRDDHRIYGIPRRLRFEQQGLCKKCGQPRYHASNHCRAHFSEHIATKYDIPRSNWDSLLQKLEDCGFTCYYTGIPLIPGVNACIDHLYPRSQSHDLSSDLDNLVWCDKWINRMKGHLSYREFVNLCRAIVDNDSKHAPVERR